MLPASFNLRNMPERVARVGDLWADMRGRSLKGAMEKVKRNKEKGKTKKERTK